MMPTALRTLARGAVLVMLLALAGCPGIPNDGRYQDHDGGRSNSRAEAPTTSLMAGGAPLQWCDLS
jgi:hypothetical protein